MAADRGQLLEHAVGAPAARGASRNGRRGRGRASLALGLILVAEPALAATVLEIGIVDFYGLRSLAASQLRPALSFAEGDTLSVGGDSRPRPVTESEQRLAQLPGVSRARIAVDCCDDGRLVVYVGIVEEGAPSLVFRDAPRGEVRLADDLMAARDEFYAALQSAVVSGNATEDVSQGHSLFHDPALRSVQERFLAYAERDRSRLIRVLRESSDARHRSFAALLLGYVADKQAVVGDLAYAMTDADASVRNDAVRALYVFAAADPELAVGAPRVPYEPFVALLDSEFHSDRNKAAAALDSLTRRRDPRVLAGLRSRAPVPLAEMARFGFQGHALSPYMILARIAGESDEAALAAFERGERESVIRAALGASEVTPTGH